MLIALTAAAALVVFGRKTLNWLWRNVVWVCQTTLIPWMRNTCGDAPADVLANALSFIDGLVVWPERVARRVRRWLAAKLAKQTSTFHKVGASTVEAITETILLNDDGTGECRVERRKLDWSELEPEIRARMRDSNAPVLVDDRDVLLTRFDEAAEENGLELEV
ncbi:MAG: hypothetical protein IKW13_04480 [Thermoguttaceae bacterium]|nr:hypothetical protein [Thermoguttaceae bacterium]